MSRVKRSYDMFSSSSTSAPSAHFSSDPHTDLSLAHKRSRPLETTLTRQMSTDDDMIKSPTTSHDKITSDALQLTAPSAAPSTSSSPFHASSSATVLSPSASSSSRSSSPSAEDQSRFPSRFRSFDVNSFVESYPHKRKRNHSNMDLSSAAPHPLFSPNKEQRTLPLSSSSSIATSSMPPTTSSLSSSSPSSSSSSQPVYSLDAVKRIVKSALQLQEDKLRDEYNAVLNELLREQFENFDRFNKDYISRQLRHNDLSYLS